MSKSIANLQSIEGCNVINHHPFGADIVSFCMQDENILIFPLHGFLDGGCYAFAVALKQYLSDVESKLYNVGRPGFTDHIVLQVMVDGVALYLDGDGLATESDLIDKTKKFQLFDAVELREFFSELHDEDKTEIFSYSEIGIPDELTKRLQVTLGLFDKDWLNLSLADDQREPMRSFSY